MKPKTDYNFWYVREHVVWFANRGMRVANKHGHGSPRSGDSMKDTVKKTLYGGPCDGLEIEVFRDKLKSKQRITVNWVYGRSYLYGLDDNGKFVWIQVPPAQKMLGS